MPPCRSFFPIEALLPCKAGPHLRLNMYLQVHLPTLSYVIKKKKRSAWCTFDIKPLVLCGAWRGQVNQPHHLLLQEGRSVFSSETYPPLQVFVRPLCHSSIHGIGQSGDVYPQNLLENLERKPTSCTSYCLLINFVKICYSSWSVF